MSKRTRLLLLTAIVIVVVGLGYAVIRLSPYLEGFEQYGYLGAFLVSFIASSTIILPAPGFVVIWALAVSPAFSWPLVALVSTLGGALGESTAYLAGYGGAAVIHPSHSKWYARAEGWMKRHGSVTIFIFSITWLPFDLVGVVAGALRFPYWKFLLATLAGRLPRTFLGCYLAYIGWDLLSDWWGLLDRMSWWGWALAGVGMALIIGGIFLWWRGRRARGRAAADCGTDEGSQSAQGIDSDG